MEPAAQPHAEGHPHDDEQGAIKLSDQQIAAAGIEVKPAEEGNLTRRRFVPGTIVSAGDRIGRVAVRLLGTVAELRKRLGDPVEQNEVVAVIESREVADAKSEYLAIRVTDELQQTLFARATSLGQGKVVTENDYLRACASAQDARVKFDTARQKLFTLGLSEEQIADLPISRRRRCGGRSCARPSPDGSPSAAWTWARLSGVKDRKASSTSSSICRSCGSILRSARRLARDPRGRTSPLSSARAASARRRGSYS